MPNEVVLTPRGLMTDPGELAAAPDGAMTEAKNVQMRRNGIIEPRPGFETKQWGNGLLAHDIKAVIPFDGDTLVAAEDVTNWQLYNPDQASEVTDESAASIQFTAGRIRSAEAAQNCYITTDNGVVRISDNADTTAYRAGMPRGLEGHCDDTTTGDVWLEDNYCTAYRIVFVREVNGARLFGPPSGRIIHRNYVPTATVNIDLTVPLADDLLVGDVVQIYRSEKATPHTSDPSDELQLRTEVTLTSAHISAGVIVFSDLLDDDEYQGPLLYTNETIEGALQENARPPYARDITSHNGVMFYAACETPHRMVLTCESIGLGVDPANAFGQIIQGTVSLTSTSLTFTITAGQAAKLKLGMNVTDDSNTSGPATASTYFQADTVVTVIDTGTGLITIDKTIQSTGTATAVTFSDSLTIDGTEYWAGQFGDGAQSVDVTNRHFDHIVSPGLLPIRDAMERLAHVVNGQTSGTTYMTVFGGSDDNDVTFLLERRTNADTLFAVRCTAPGAFTGESLTFDTDVNSKRDGGGHWLMWSKEGLPEAVPGTHFATIGSERHPIKRIISTRDAVFVFKSDGVWRVTASGPSSVRIDEHDQTLNLLHPDTAVALDDKVYCLTNQGVVAVGDGGKLALSDSSIDESLRIFTHALVPDDTIEGVFGISWQAQDTYLLGVPANASDGYAEYVYAFNSKTMTWARWNFDADSRTIRCGAYNPADDLMYLCGDDGTDGEGYVEVDGTTDATVYAYDVRYVITASDVTGATVTINGGSGWTPAIGDTAVIGGIYGVVTSVASTTVFDVRATATFTAGAGKAYKAPASVVAWSARTGKAPHIQKHWRDCTLMFEESFGVALATVGFTTELSTTEGTITHEVTPSIGGTPRNLRGFVTRNHSRSTRLNPKVTIQCAATTWRLAGLSLTFEPMSERV